MIIFGKFLLDVLALLPLTDPFFVSSKDEFLEKYHGVIVKLKVMLFGLPEPSWNTFVSLSHGQKNLDER